MRLVIVTVGFDEKLPLRGLLKIGLDSGDAVLLVYSRTGGEFEVKKVEKAVESIKEFIGKTGVSVFDVEVSAMDFYRDVKVILRALSSLGRPADEMIALLVGGMRLLIFEALVAVLLHHSLTGVGVRVRLMREDGMYEVDVPVEAFHLTVSSREAGVIRLLAESSALKRSKLVDSASHSLEVSESMVYKLIKKLSKKGLIAIEGDAVKLTELGCLATEALR